MTSSERRKPNYSRRLTWLGVFIVVLFGGYSAAWFYLAAQLEAVAGAAIAGLNHGGTSAECANPTARGFPFRIGLYCDGLRYANADEKVGARPPRSARPRRSTIRCTSSPSSTARRAISGPGGSAITFDWGNLRASVRLADRLPEQLSAEVVNCRRRPRRPDRERWRRSDRRRRICGRTGDDLDLAGSFDGADIDPKLLGGADLPPFEGAADLTIKDGVNLARFGGSLRGQSGTIRTLSISSGGTAGLSVAGPFSVGADGLLDADLKVSSPRSEGAVGAARQGVSGQCRADRGEPFRASPRSATTRRCR